jgi:type IV secretion system protein VirD4
MMAIVRALSNLTRAVVRDPIWALIAVVTSPVKFFRYIVTTLIVLVLTAAVLITLAIILKYWLRIPDGSYDEYLLAVIIAFILFFVLVRMLSVPLLNHFGDTGPSDTHGSARFASPAETAFLKANEGLLIGRDAKSGHLLRYDGPAHLLTMAPTRTGKGVGTVIPNLLVQNRSVICIDPKGENTRVTGRARYGFGPVHILDPFEVTGDPTASYNPFDRLDPDSIDIAEDAAVLADALVYDEPGQSGEAHWNEEAKALITGIILLIAASEPAETRNLSKLRECLTLSPDAFLDLLEVMSKMTECNGLIRRAAYRHLAKSAREAAGVLSSAQRHTHFLDSPRMAKVLSKSDFSFADLKARTATVFLVLPPDRLNTYSRWLRLMVVQSLTDMARASAGTHAPVLYLLDEFAALGYLAPVERAMGLMAGYGVQLWPILQDIHQLKATYGQKAGTFLSNAGALQVFGVNDHESAKLISDLLGQETVSWQSRSIALDSGSLSFSGQQTGRSLLTPDEVRNLRDDTELLFLAGQRPIAARKLRYYDQREFKGLFEPI